MSLITYITKIHFAESVLEDALEAELEHLGICRPLIVADDSAERRFMVERLLASMPADAEPVLFETEKSTATEPDCEAAAALYSYHDADGIIGFGGSAAISLAKAVGLTISHGGTLARFSNVEGSSARRRRDVPPMLAIPTTPGSCPEALGIAVLSMREGPHLVLGGPNLVPRVVICDPTLTLDLAPERIASAGMDVLTHCVETFVATAYNPPADGIARDGLRRAVANLERAVAETRDLAAHRELMAAGLNGALASQKGLGGAHAMSHALGSVSRRSLDHGAVNAVLLPHVLEFNAPAVSTRYREIACDFGPSLKANLPDAIIRLRERVCLPASLSAMGVEADEIDRASVFAETDQANRTNPRRADAADYRAMMLAAS